MLLEHGLRRDAVINELVGAIDFLAGIVHSLDGVPHASLYAVAGIVASAHTNAGIAFAFPAIGGPLAVATSTGAAVVAGAATTAAPHHVPINLDGLPDLSALPVPSLPSSTSSLCVLRPSDGGPVFVTLSQGQVTSVSAAQRLQAPARVTRAAHGSGLASLPSFVALPRDQDGCRPPRWARSGEARWRRSEDLLTNRLAAARARSWRRWRRGNPCPAAGSFRPWGILDRRRDLGVARGT